MDMPKESASTSCEAGLRPKPLKKPDLTELRKLVEVYITENENPNFDHESRVKGLMFEAAVTAFYGHDVWRWINRRNFGWMGHFLVNGKLEMDRFTRFTK